MNFCKNSFHALIKDHSLEFWIITQLIVKEEMIFDYCIFLSLWFSTSKNNFFSFVHLQKFQATIHTLICPHFELRKNGSA